MKTYIAFLRGINVSGHKLIKMEELRNAISSLGFQNVISYIQSGNLVFNAKNENADSIKEKLNVLIKNKFSFDVPIIVKDLSELKAIVFNNPFLNIQGIDNTAIYFTFFATNPKIIDYESIQNQIIAPDQAQLLDNVLYLYCPNKYSNTVFTNNFLEKKLKTTATSRNLKTITELLKLADSSITY